MSLCQVKVILYFMKILLKLNLNFSALQASSNPIKIFTNICVDSRSIGLTIFTLWLTSNTNLIPWFTRKFSGNQWTS